jgi:integrase
LSSEVRPNPEKSHLKSPPGTDRVHAVSKLSAAQCLNARPTANGGDRFLGDGDGLFLPVRQSGTRTWLIEYVVNGVRRKVTIGAFDKQGALGESTSGWLDDGRLSLAQARAIAGQWKTDRLAGRDPAADREAQLAARKAAEAAQRAAMEREARQPTVKEAVEAFATKYLTGKKSGASMRYRLDRLAKEVGHRNVRDLTRKDIVAALEKIAEGCQKGRTAKQLAGEVLVHAKRLWRYAVVCEWIDASCIEVLTRADIDARPRRRSVVLHLDEIAELWRALADPERCKSDVTTIAALRLLILTGQRESEVAEAEWSEFDLDAALWRLPAKRTKSGRAHLVHLAPLAVSILEALRTTTGKGRYVFASPLRARRPIFGRSINNALRGMFKRGVLARVTPCHVHDLRRTLITRLPDLGFEPFIGHKIANHVLPGVLGHYNHNEYLPQRQAALVAWAEQIEVLALAKNVVRFARVAA